MNIIDDILSTFSPVSLEELESVKLMNRTDTKFVFRADQLPLILSQLAATHDVLEINDQRMQRYETIYFDTPDHKCYLDHHNKRSHRFKIRSRKYTGSGLTYFEIKIKNNKGRTRKERNKQHTDPMEITGKPAALLARETGLTPEAITPAIRVDFSRITLVDHLKTVRITIDTGLTFSKDMKTCSYPFLVIAEIKQDKNHHAVFQELLHRNHIHPFRISKYCLGMISLDNTLRYNNFKQKLHVINKLNHDFCKTDHPLSVAFVPGIAR
jgi:hypothetical protein